MKIFDDVIACDLRFIPPPTRNPGYAYALNHVQYAYQTPVAASLILLTHLHEPSLTTLQRYKAAKYTLHCFQSKICLVWKYGMEWNMEDYVSMDWKIFSMEWKKIASMEYEKIVFHSIPFHALSTVVASHANAHARAIAFFSYIWFKYISSMHCCKLGGVVVMILSSQPSAHGTT